MGDFFIHITLNITSPKTLYENIYTSYVFQLFALRRFLEIVLVF
jgi:hypothetical protein